jgi:hypothetical protein
MNIYRWLFEEKELQRSIEWLTAKIIVLNDQVDTLKTKIDMANDKLYRLIDNRIEWILADRVARITKLLKPEGSGSDSDSD